MNEIYLYLQRKAIPVRNNKNKRKKNKNSVKSEEKLQKDCTKKDHQKRRKIHQRNDDNNTFTFIFLGISNSYSFPLLVYHCKYHSVHCVSPLASFRLRSPDWKRFCFLLFFSFPFEVLMDVINNPN